LPTWYDTCQTAAKVEYLGIGVYASKKVAPEVSEEELTAAIREVLGSEEMRGKARELGEMCRARKGGREVAADLVEEIVRGLVQSSES
jgi:UDP:flavonoid glycosyltransferase YjiC (YdhE family)